MQHAGQHGCKATEYKSTDSPLPPPPFCNCNALRESHSMDGLNIPCASLKRRRSWVISNEVIYTVISVYLWMKEKETEWGGGGGYGISWAMCRSVHGAQLNSDDLTPTGVLIGILLSMICTVMENREAWVCCASCSSRCCSAESSY
jgi:hypothetical protein